MRERSQSENEEPRVLRMTRCCSQLSQRPLGESLTPVKLPRAGRRAAPPAPQAAASGPVEMMRAVTVLFVAIGGLAGVLARYGISSAFHGAALPWATVAINTVGSFMLGYFVVAPWFSPEVRVGVGVGLLGGFTTYSTFSVQAILDADAGELRLAVLYTLASIVLGLGAAAAGFLLARAHGH